MFKFFNKKSTINFLIALIFTALLTFIASIFFVWWNIIFVAFFINLIFKQKPFNAFLSGFLAIFLLWFGLIFYLSYSNTFILSNVISVMFLGFKSSYIMIFISSFIGGFIGGLGALLGSHFTAILIKNKNYIYIPKTSKNLIKPEKIDINQNKINNENKVTKENVILNTEIHSKKKEEIKEKPPIVKKRKLTLIEEIREQAYLEKQKNAKETESLETNKEEQTLTNTKKPNFKITAQLQIPKSSTPFIIPAIKKE